MLDFVLIEIKFDCCMYNTIIKSHLRFKPDDEEEEKCELRYNIKNYREEIENTVEVMPKDTRKLKEIINSHQISLLPEGLSGMDGYNVEVKIRRGESQVKYIWWVKPGEQWYPLKEMVDIVKKYLPERNEITDF